MKTKIQALPNTGFVRLETVLHVFPVGRSTWWAGVKSGKYPAAVKLGPTTTAWRAEDIHALIARASRGEFATESHGVAAMKKLHGPKGR